MRYYLDTSSLRSASNKLVNLKVDNVFTSSLSIFELISGITNEKEYQIRKSVLINVLDSKVFIDWDTWRKKMYSSVSADFEDDDTEAIREMANIIYHSNSYENIDKECKASGKWFDLGLFNGFDKHVSDLGKEDAELGLNLWHLQYNEDSRKDMRAKIFDEKENLFKSFVCNMKGIGLTKFIESMADSKRPSEEYFKVLKKYDNSIDFFLSAQQVLYSLSQLQGRVCGENDTVDSLHTIYMTEKDETIIVSNDKIFKLFENYITNFKRLSLEKFLEEVV